MKIFEGVGVCLLMFVLAFLAGRRTNQAEAHGGELTKALERAGDQILTSTILAVTKYLDVLSDEHEATFFAPSDAAWRKAAKRAKLFFKDTILLSSLAEFVSLAAASGNNSNFLYEELMKNNMNTTRGVLKNILEYHHLKGVSLNATHFSLFDLSEGHPPHIFLTYDGEPIFYLPATGDLGGSGNAPATDRANIIKKDLYNDGKIALHSIDAVVFPISAPKTGMRSFIPSSSLGMVIAKVAMIVCVGMFI